MIQEFNGFAGQFLIAMPQMNDPNFHYAVILLCEHSETGAMGIVINRPTDLFLSELLDQLDVEAKAVEKHVYFGGPVQIERGFVLHSSSGAWQSSMAVKDDIIVTGSKDILEAIATGNGPEEYLVALGYAGWGAGQLEKEVADNYWLICPANADTLFRQPYENRFDISLKQLGIDPSQLSIKAGHD
jgi:putative transcriptional regulator